MKTKLTKKYVAPKMEFIEMEPREVLCQSIDTSAGLMNFTVGEGQWVVP
jgi:hypothetical protein